jgi:hypothetical protein
MALKAEALGLAVMLELPLVVVDVQRGGPSTGLPTKIEQSDLLQAIYGRHGECPVPVIAARSPADCFDCALVAFRLAVKYKTPVIRSRYPRSTTALWSSREGTMMNQMTELPLTKKDFEHAWPRARDRHRRRERRHHDRPGDS